ncbi:23S rRNA pseudouridine(2605) synthase RluB [Pseudidiomarina andamanensis]|uniref:Pseudouridine synthase n=1 Tax=Pseudidiomarina andamanensis TaxID=1940690 RepID=A0AA92ETE1_9GAMM|nr:23S rRNA pseudouridine(2605) synthase RluB [Pseudidiomarina andamanensis]MDS0218722.1 23S rRNA pseudouridine(2605) synthase RluB [Pseudidiomarina andamanensis]QGT95583.1 23S rRNA pseudouridine(2605) synthase RluB [Pseudidiomarina andamanensis]
MSEKLQKVLARSGHGSRRELESIIAAGRVSVNGQVATLGERIDTNAIVRIDGREVNIKQPEDVVCRVLMYHKPEGELCTRRDPEGRPTVYDRLPRMQGARWVAVGRLDVNTSGLLLFTTDGELANRLMHPGHEIEREYSVRVFGEVTDAMMRKLKQGVQLEDGPAAFKEIKRGGGEGMNQWFRVVLTEGRNREVRRLWESQGVQVSRLIRVRYGNIKLEQGLPQSGWGELSLKDINYLRDLVELPEETRTFIDPRQGESRQKRYSRARRINAQKLQQRTPGAKVEEAAPEQRKAPRKNSRRDQQREPQRELQREPRNPRGKTPSKGKPSSRSNADKKRKPSGRQRTRS